MPRNGSGTYTRTDGTFTGSTVWAQVKAAVQQLTATRLDTHDQDIASALTASIAKDGQTIPTANLPMGGFAHTNVAAATETSNYARYDQLLNSSAIWGGTAGGTADVSTLTLPVAPSAYVAGQRYSYISPASQNTTSVTLNINGLGAKTIQTLDGINLKADQIALSRVVEVLYDGTVFRLLNNPSRFTSYTPTYTPTGGTFTSVTTTFAYFKWLDSSNIFVQLSFNGTSGSTMDFLAVSLPIAHISSNSSGFNAAVTNAGVSSLGYCQFSLGTGVIIYPQQNTSSGFADGATGVLLSGIYRAN